MASIIFNHNYLPFLLSILFLSLSSITHAADPDILTDFIVPVNSNTTIDGIFFTFTGLHLNQSKQNFTVTKVSMKEFPALNGQSVSMAVLNFPAGSVNPPHTHPRSAELLFVTKGALEVGFIDTTNKLFTQTLKLGDIFVFPKGLVHYQYNADSRKEAEAVSAFGSANAGTVSVPVTVFGTGIDDAILAKAFKTHVGTIKKIKAGLGTKV